MVRNRRIVLISLLCASVALAQDTEDAPKPTIQWATSYAEGMATATAQKRPALIKFSAQWCKWCERMDVEVFVDDPVIQALQGYTCIKVDVDERPDVAMAYSVRSLPRVMVINTHQEIVGDWLGYQRPDRFLAMVMDLEPALHTKMGTLMAPKTILPVPKAEPEVSVDLTEEPVMNLGHRDPKVRKKAVVLWVARGKKALPEIVEHLEHAYLGVRIGAWKVVQKLHASKLPFDPWAPLLDRTAMIRALQDELPPQP
jgi:thioredoxin-related protein